MEKVEMALRVIITCLAGLTAAFVGTAEFAKATLSEEDRKEYCKSGERLFVVMAIGLIAALVGLPKGVTLQMLAICALLFFNMILKEESLRNLTTMVAGIFMADILVRVIMGIFTHKNNFGLLIPVCAYLVFAFGKDKILALMAAGSEDGGETLGEKIKEAIRKNSIFIILGIAAVIAFLALVSAFTK